MSSSIENDITTIYQRPAELLQNLIRFNTTNPPGNEGEFIHYINHLVNEAEISQEKVGIFCSVQRGGAVWTIPELLFEKKYLIPALQQLLQSHKKPLVSDNTCLF
jgi:acetylornithine deacetylase/succinyl-diaminopimelate desuccinylase-like protein